MIKKILKISAYILIALACALLAYYFLISTNDTPGSPKKPFFSNLFPFGNNPTVVSEVPFATTTEITPDEPVAGNFSQVMRLISNEPVAGSMFIETQRGDIVRYIEKATGHIYDVPTFENTVSRISNTTIPQLYTAKFTENGSGFITQYIKDDNSLETLYGKIISTSTEQTVVGTILSRNIVSFDVSPNGKTIFTLETTQNGSEGYISTPTGTNKKLVWASPLKEFIPQYISDTHVGLQTKPYVSASGILFDVDTNTSAKKVLVSNHKNLTTLPYINKNYVLYSNTIGLFTTNTSTGTSQELSPRTFAEKCVWAHTKTYVYCAVPQTILNSGSLYAWYKGELSYSDTIWEYNVEKNTARELVNPVDVDGRSVDVSSISINKSDTLLLIQSKTDGSLWTIKVN